MPRGCSLDVFGRQLLMLIKGIWLQAPHSHYPLSFLQSPKCFRQTQAQHRHTEAAAVTPAAAGHWLFPRSGKKAASDIQKLPQMTRLQLLCTLLLASLLRRPGGCCPPNTHLSSRNHGLGSFHPWPSSRRRNCCRDTSTSLLSPSHTTLAISMNYLYYISSFITHTLLGGVPV